MAWVTPRIWTVLEQATAAKMNEISAALNDLDRRTSPAMASVATLESTASLSFTDLATVGPAATATVGTTGKALVAIHVRQYNATSGQVSLASVALSGATTVAASDGGICLTFTSPTASGDIRHGTTIIGGGYNPGVTTATLKFRATGGTASFESRYLAFQPLGS